MNSPQTKRLNHWTFQNRDQILPVHAVTFKSVLIPILKEHKFITISKDLFMDIIGMILKVDHLYFPAVFGHEYKYITVIGIMMRHLFDNLNVIFLFCREINGEKKNFCLVTNPRKKLKYSMFSEAES